MKYRWCTIMTAKLEESIVFYKDVLGLKIMRQFEIGDRQFVFLSDGNVEVELIYSPDQLLNDSIQGISLGFEIDTLENAMAHMSSYQVEIESGPFEPNPMIAFFYVRDPNGVQIQCIQDKNK